MRRDHSRQVDTINRLFDAGAITDEVYNAEIDRIANQAAEEAAYRAREEILNYATSSSSHKAR